MENSYTGDWANIDIWESHGLSYSDKTEALTFTDKEFIESAVLNVEIPAGTKSFSLSIKTGSMTEKGDTGYITVGFGEGSNIMSFRSNGISSTSYVETSLGSSSDPINIVDGSKNMYIKVEVKNDEMDDIDFFFKDLDVKFYNSKGQTDFYGNLTSETFIQTNTEEKVAPPDNGPRVLIFILLIAALGGGVFAYKKLKDRMYAL